jgi:alpha-N-arabinofuranosidase
MFEDINHSGDGGIYGELLNNRAFQGQLFFYTILCVQRLSILGSSVKMGALHGLEGSSIVASENPTIPNGPVLTGWSPIGSARMTLDILHPLSEALPTVMKLDIPSDAKGEVGFMNNGLTSHSVDPVLNKLT